MMGARDGDFSFNDGRDLKEYFEKILAERDRALDMRFDASEKAIKIAQAAQEHRFEGVNAFREQLREQTASFVTKVEFAARLEGLCADVQGLKESRAELRGKASQQSVMGSYGLAVTALLTSILGLIAKLT